MIDKQTENTGDRGGEGEEIEIDRDRGRQTESIKHGSR